MGVSFLVFDDVMCFYGVVFHLSVSILYTQSNVNYEIRTARLLHKEKEKAKNVQK
jgi:hypothetical protein